MTCARRPSLRTGFLLVWLPWVVSALQAGTLLDPSFTLDPNVTGWIGGVAVQADPTPSLRGGNARYGANVPGATGNSFTTQVLDVMHRENPHLDGFYRDPGYEPCFANGVHGMVDNEMRMAGRLPTGRCS